MPLTLVRVVSLVNLKNLVCPTCNCAVDQSAVETCAECLGRWLDMTRSVPVRPCILHLQHMHTVNYSTENTHGVASALRQCSTRMQSCSYTGTATYVSMSVNVTNRWASICYFKYDWASDHVTHTTMRKWSRVLSTLRLQIAGSSKALLSQLADELSTTCPEERKTLLEKAGIKPEIPVGQGLVMKAELSIPWNKLRHLRSVYKIFFY